MLPLHDSRGHAGAAPLAPLLGMLPAMLHPLLAQKEVCAPERGRQLGPYYIGPRAAYMAVCRIAHRCCSTSSACARPTARSSRCAPRWPRRRRPRPPRRSRRPPTSGARARSTPSPTAWADRAPRPGAPELHGNMHDHACLLVQLAYLLVRLA